MMQILVTRPLEESIKLAQILAEMGHLPIISPLLEIELFNNINTKNFSKYQSVIVSSKNAIKAISHADKSLELLIVGEQTTKFAKSLGFTNSICAGTCMEELKAYIQNYNNLLYLSGVDVSDDLGSLEKNIDRLVVYNAGKIKSISAEFFSFIKSNQLRLCLFLSQRTAQVFLDLVKENKLESYCKSLISLSLSQKIANELKDLKLNSSYTTKEPTLKSLISSINKICR